MKKLLNSVLIAIFFVLLIISTSFATPGLVNIFDNIFEDNVPEYTASEELTEKLISQTVSITSFNEGISTCSGVVIYEDDKNHYVLTAKHCTDVTEEMYVEHNKVLYIVTFFNR